MKKFLLYSFSWLLFTGMLSLHAQEIPTGYYDKAIGKSGKALQEALSTILNNGAKDVGYDGLYSVYRTSDNRNGKVWDMYSDITDFSFSNTCGNYKNEGDCYNREHSVPQSWFNEARPMKSDAWLVYPTDGKINGYRSNNPFGEVGSKYSSSANGFSKWGTSATPGITGTVFEPNDMYKGDFARAYFYIATRYADKCGNWQSQVFSSSFPHLAKPTLDMMLRWHQKDAVSEKEIVRNNAVYNEQRNRNPFIDYPELVDLIFGDRTDEPFNPDGSEHPYLISPLNGSTINIGTTLFNHSVSNNILIQGKNIENDLTLTLSGTDATLFSLSETIVSASDINDGKQITVTYLPTEVGLNNATLTISGKDLAYSTQVTLTGKAIDGFAALDPINITSNSFTAQWSAANGATGYLLDVYYLDNTSSGEEVTVLNTNFKELTQIPKGWETSGFAAIEGDNGVRLASGSRDGSISTPALDLSGNETSLYIKASPYKGAASLYIYLDGKKIDELNVSRPNRKKDATTGRHTIFGIKLEASSDKRIYVEGIIISKGGGYKEVRVNGYPKQVGNTLSETVTGLTPSTEYYYTVTPIGGTASKSNEIKVTTSDDPAALPDITDISYSVIYSNTNRLYVSNAPANTKVYVFTIDGQLILERTLHDENLEEYTIDTAGVYIVKIVSPQGSKSNKVIIEN